MDDEPDGPEYFTAGARPLHGEYEEGATIYALRFPLETHEILTVFVSPEGLEAFHTMLHEARLDAFIDDILEDD